MFIVEAVIITILSIVALVIFGLMVDVIYDAAQNVTIKTWRELRTYAKAQRIRADIAGYDQTIDEMTRDKRMVDWNAVMVEVYKKEACERELKELFSKTGAK